MPNARKTTAMPFISINDRTLHYLDEGVGPALLMGHTYLASHSVWREQVNVLKRHYRCIVPDLWGHGLSSSTPEISVSVRSLAEDYWVLMQALGVDDYSVIGQVVGGMWGVQMALDYPDSVNALVLINPDALTCAAENRRLYFEILNTVEKQNAVPKDVIEQLVPLFFSPVTRKEKSELIVAFEDSLSAIKGCDLPTLVDMGRNIMAQTEMWVDVGKLSVPTLILTGEHAKVCGSSAMGPLSKTIRGADFRLIPKAGYLPCLEQPDVVNVHLCDFLERVHGELVVN